MNLSGKQDSWHSICGFEFMTMRKIMFKGGGD